MAQANHINTKPRHSVVVTQTAFTFAASDRAEPLTGDRTRVVRIAVQSWDKVSLKIRRALKVLVATVTRRKNLGTTMRPSWAVSTMEIRLRWNNIGECVVVDGGATHANVVAILAENGLTYTERADAGRWCVVGGMVLLRCPEIVDGATARDLMPVGMPVLALRGDTWTRWRGAPRLWPYERALVSQIARVA